LIREDVNGRKSLYDFPAGEVAGLAPGPQPEVEAVLPAVEQQDAPSPPALAQHSDLPSAIVEQLPSLPPQQPLPPAAVLHSMPAALHLQPSEVPPVVEVGLELAATMFGSLAGAVDEVALELFADLLPFPLPVLPVFALPGPQPANASTTNASNATNLIFMGGLLLCRDEPFQSRLFAPGASRVGELEKLCLNSPARIG
jgi:hypothetical protein